MKSVTFINCSDQLTVQTDKTVYGSHANYFIRTDGAAERKTVGDDTLVLIPAKAKYVSASAGDQASYLIRDDGVACRTKSKGEISHEMVAENGSPYIKAAAGSSCAYLLRADGSVDRTVRNGVVHLNMRPPGREEWLEYQSNGGCMVM